MDWIRILLSRFAALFNAGKLDADLDEELQSHIDLAVEEHRRRGLPPAEARTAALRAFGGVAQTRERYRSQRGVPFIEQLVRDLRFASRQLMKSPGFTLVALLTLALGIGANTVVFSLVNGLLLRPLPVPDAGRLAVLRIEEGGPQANYAFCTPFFRSLEKRHDVFANVFAFDRDLLQVRGHDGSENVPGVLVSGQFFQALETPPLLGRYLTPQDDRPGGSPAGLAVVISESFWKTWFNRAPDVVGRKLVIANTPFTVVGVMPRQFIGADPMQRPDIFAPLSADPIIDAPRNHIDDGIHAWWIYVMAQLQPGVSMEQANAELRTVSDPILHEAGADARYVADEEKHHFHFAAEPGSRGYNFARTLFRKPLAAMFAMCGGILLLACLNLASLLMARGAARKRELATRLALGAARSRLIRQLLTESLLLAVLGTAAGLAVAPIASHSLAAILLNGSNGMQLDTSIDFRIFGFAALIAVVSALLIGLIPALQATAGNLSEAIKDGQHTRQVNESRRILPRILLASEVSIAVMLLVCAGLLTTSLRRLFQSGVGFDPKGLVNVAFSMDKQQLDGEPLMQLYRQLGDGLSRQPGVRSVSFQFIVPLSHVGWNGDYSTPEGGKHLIFLNAVAPDYFSTMRMPVFMGREFSWSDTRASGLKMILNQTAAKQLFLDGDALGHMVLNPSEKTSYQVVALVGDSKYRDMTAPAPPIGYVPIMQDEQKKPSLTAVVRTDGPQKPLAAAARALTAKLAPGIPPPIVTTMDDVLNESISAQRIMAMLSAFFAGCALLVTGIGLYGTLTYSTARRTSEIGLRIALGARRAGVVAMVFKENAAIAAAGSAAGLIAAVLLSRALAGFLYETSPHDPWVLAGAVGALTVIASAASLLPALRASRIEPMQALRTE